LESSAVGLGRRWRLIGYFPIHLLPPGDTLQAKTDSQVRWAVLNTVLLLRAQKKAHEALAAAMGRAAR
jgi:hypothetical protein